MASDGGSVDRSDEEEEEEDMDDDEQLWEQIENQKKAQKNAKKAKAKRKAELAQESEEEEEDSDGWESEEERRPKKKRNTKQAKPAKTKSEQSLVVLYRYIHDFHFTNVPELSLIWELSSKLIASSKTLPNLCVHFSVFRTKEEEEETILITIYKYFYVICNYYNKILNSTWFWALNDQNSTISINY